MGSDPDGGAVGRSKAAILLDIGAAETLQVAVLVLTLVSALVVA